MSNLHNIFAIIALSETNKWKFKWEIYGKLEEICMQLNANSVCHEPVFSLSN